MPEFGSISPQRPMVYLKSQNSSYNITWSDADKLIQYLKSLKIEVIGIVAISSEAHEYDRKWVIDNKYDLKEPMYLQMNTRVNQFDGVTHTATEVFGHNVAVLAANVQSNPRWSVERLLEEHGVTGKELTQFYLQFDSVQEAVNKLF